MSDEIPEELSNRSVAVLAKFNALLERAGLSPMDAHAEIHYSEDRERPVRFKVGIYCDGEENKRLRGLLGKIELAKSGTGDVDFYAKHMNELYDALAALEKALPKSRAASR